MKPVTTISIVGNARNMHGQAAIVTESADTYFVNGKETWEKEWLNCRIKLIGDLELNESKQIKYVNQAVVQRLDE